MSNENPKTKIVHRAALIRPDGSVSARCFDPPRAIDLKKATWTLRDGLVTCTECRAVATTTEPPDEEGIALHAQLREADERGDRAEQTRLLHVIAKRAAARAGLAS